MGAGPMAPADARCAGGDLLEEGGGKPVPGSAVCGERRLCNLIARSPSATDPESLRDPRLFSFWQPEGRGHWPGQISVH